MSQAQQISGYSEKEATRMKILADLKAKEEKEKQELIKQKAEKQQQEEKTLEEKKKAEELALKKAKRKAFIRKFSISSLVLIMFSFILFVPKVSEIEYKSLNGTETVFYINSDLLGFYDTQIVDNPLYDSVNIDESKSQISFCSTKYTNVKCFDTVIIQKKGTFSSFTSYFAYLQNKFSHSI